LNGYRIYEAIGDKSQVMSAFVLAHASPLSTSNTVFRALADMYRDVVHSGLPMMNAFQSREVEDREGRKYNIPAEAY